MAETKEDNAMLMDRQRRYDALAQWFGAPDDRASASAFALHQKIVRVLDGHEPHPPGYPDA